MSQTVVFALCLLVLPSTQDDGAALREAATRGDLKTVEKLIEAKAPLDATNEYGRTALSMAAGKGQLDVMRMLIKAGADIEKADRFTTSLH